MFGRIFVITDTTIDYACRQDSSSVVVLTQVTQLASQITFLGALLPRLQKLPDSSICGHGDFLGGVVARDLTNLYKLKTIDMRPVGWVGVYKVLMGSRENLPVLPYLTTSQCVVE
jgi:hypothetical protein